MNEPQFPTGWDAARVQRVIDAYEEMSEEELADEDDAATETRPGQSVVTIPDGLLPAVRQLLASYKGT